MISSATEYYIIGRNTRSSAIYLHGTSPDSLLHTNHSVHEWLCLMSIGSLAKSPPAWKVVDSHVIHTGTGIYWELGWLLVEDVCLPSMKGAAGG